MRTVLDVLAVASVAQQRPIVLDSRDSSDMARLGPARTEHVTEEGSLIPS